MAIYHYKQSSLIERIEVRTPQSGTVLATVIAKKNADPAQFEVLRNQLGSHSFSTLMDEVDGHAALQVRGLKDPKDLLSVIETLGHARGGITEVATADDNNKSQGLMDFVRDKSLFLSAIFYDIGNAAFFASGIQRGRHNKDKKFTANDKSEMMIGAAFSVGDVLMTLYGKDKGDEQLRAASEGLKNHLKRKGIEIPQGNALNPDTLHQSGAAKATSEWLREHMIQIKCLSEFAGGLFTMHAAMKPGNHNHGKLTAGLLISTGWLATLLLDKPHGHEIFDGDKPPPSTLAGKMSANPRGWIARPLAMGNNIANLWGSLNPRTGERKRFMNEVTEAQKQLSLNNTAENRAHLAYTQAKQHDYSWNIVSACSFLVAHTLFGISGSKRPKETSDDTSMMQDLVLLSANVLAQQPEAVQKSAIEETAEYVSTLAHVKLGKQQLAEAIRDKINSLSHSSWATRIHASAATTGTPLAI